MTVLALLGVPGWGPHETLLLALLPVLLLLSGFFSGSETALFALTHAQRERMAQHRPKISAALNALMVDRRMLLITILMGNMLVNVLYLVTSSVLLLEVETGAVGTAALALGFLLCLIAGGEVGPKMAANSHLAGFATLIALPLFAVHRAVAPVRVVLARFVIAPLHRLAAPGHAPEELHEEDLDRLLEVSRLSGVIDARERGLLADVLALSRRRVQDVMTPRVRMGFLRTGDGHDAIRALARESRLTRLPVCEGDLDHVTGFLSVASWLRAGDDAAPSSNMLPALFVPEIATLDDLLTHFRSTRTSLAIAVDEYGGTAGIVALQDVVASLVGAIEEPAP